MSKNILEFFPHDEPRPSQITALEWLSEQDAKYLLLEAPVGVGKSAVGICFSRWLTQGFGSSFILTPQRILQEQYVRTFTDGTLASLYGKSNYTCRDRNTTCDIGSLITPRCKNCPHQKAVKSAVSSPNTVLNYKLAMLLFGFTPMFEGKRRELMVLDECHTVESHLTEFNAVTIQKHRAEKYGVTEWPETHKTNILQAQEWLLNVYLPGASNYLNRLSQDVEPALAAAKDDGYKLTRADIKKITECNRLEDHIDSLTEFGFVPEDTLVNEYVLVFDKKSFKFKMITGAKNFRHILKPNANRFLFMSSTILNKDGFAADLGLPPEDTAFLSLDSEFPKENRPVFYIPQTKMNASWNDNNRKKDRTTMLSGVKKLLTMHDDENGIIHTGNFAIADWLVDNLNRWSHAKHNFIHHNPSSGDDRNAIIRQFTTTKQPTVLLSPSITEGLDLVDDQARFAIFCKVPFGYLGDQWIKRRMQMSKEWYQRQALISIIQGGGRVVRSNTDEGVVYILDQSWGYLYSQTVNRLPRWWKESYTQV